MKPYWLLLPLGLTACATQAPLTLTTPLPPEAAAETLPRYHWQLADARDAHGKRVDMLFVRRDAPVQLDFVDGRLAIGNLCNRMAAGYRADAATLTVSRLASTLMACADPKLALLDDAMATRLEGALPFAVQGQPPRLKLTARNGDVLVFDGTPTAQTRYGSAGETVFFEIAAEEVACPHPLMKDARCLSVREVHYDAQGLENAPRGEWQNLYAPIEGYRHQAGTRNVLRLKRYAVPNPPADGSTVAYVLDMVVQTETVQP